ncbi:hypothetical protein Aph01nite_59960 [Acrocarpospora phusangensis]|uniref:Condensation domain-containing protein n=1 Tax=Acrocarpospora phusangensis TaxID=1070424 RepID=A0A919QF34_9ACTN|nr:condensation domain-containing protein [Acrocarpospora phusangensis]GIH27686.1 hypothetical protein Aph01nite_59960 [Acrocarpospora phusangensis]
MYADFGGGRSGQAPLTWGQRGIWDAMARNPPGHFNIGRVLMVPRRGGAEVAEVARAVGLLAKRHEALRTQVALVEGEPRQVVRASGRIPLTVVAADPADAAEAACGFLTRWTAEAFDHEVEWPLRVGVVSSGGRVRWMALVLSHLAADGHATEIVLRDLRLLLRQDAIGGPPPAQPLDLAREQHDAGARRTRAAIDFWTGQYERVAPVMFSPVHTGSGPRHRRVRLTSEPLAAAAGKVADRHRVSSSTVLLAATAALVGARTGHASVALSTIVGNRFSAGLRGMVTTLDQLGLFVLDLAPGAGLDELVPRAWRAALAAYRHAYYDQPALDAALAAMGRRRGAELNPYCCFNDVRQPGGGSAVAPDASSRLDWLPDPDGIRCRFCLLVGDAPGAGLVLQLTADTRCLTSDQIARFLPELENLVLSAV